MSNDTIQMSNYVRRKIIQINCQVSEVKLQSIYGGIIFRLLNKLYAFSRKQQS